MLCVIIMSVIALYNDLFTGPKNYEIYEHHNLALKYELYKGPRDTDKLHTVTLELMIY